MAWGPNSEEDTARFLRRAIVKRSREPRTQFELAVTLKESSQLIGACGIRVSNLELREGDIGYCLTRDHWGRGYATEAAR